jgi:hypothetical protein
LTATRVESIFPPVKLFGVIAMFTALATAGCAKASLGDRDAGGGGGDLDMSVEGPVVDFAGVDIAGWDLRPDPRDLAGLDLRPPPCVVFPQSGCNTGEKCQLTGPMSSQCVADGNKNTGQLCGPATDDCVKGSLCTSESMTLNQCRAFCGADTDCTATPVNGIGGKCIITLTGSTYKLCTVPCNPVFGQPTGCATGLGCEVFGVMGGGQGTDCTVMGSGGDGADCATNGNADCQSGFTCVNVMLSGGGTVKKCRRVCRSGVNTDCSGGYACVSPSSGPATYGFCCPGGNCQ